MGRKKRRKAANARKADQNIVEGSGICMEIRQPENIAVAIPEKEAENIASIGLGIKIKSFVDTVFLFKDDAYLVEIVRDGEIFEAETHINKNIPNNVVSWRLLKSGFHGDIILDFVAEIYWKDNLLCLKISTIVLNYERYIASESWNFQGLKPGIYQLRFIYQNKNQSCEPPSYVYEDFRIIDCKEAVEIFRDTLTTAKVNIDLLQPIESKSDSVEVDGMVFRNLIPYTEISLKKTWSSNAKFHVGGIQIFNNTHKAYYFSVHFTIEPRIISEDGEVVFVRELDSDWFQLREENTDIFLSKPNKNTFLFPGTYLYKAGNKRFRLVFYANYGGGWGYESLELNKTYKINFTYTNSSPSSKNLGIGTDENDEILFWTGKVSTPFVEFRLVI
ncbi:MAG: hypothetical protein WBA41_12460 [Rivularia sp. (in: cyanobacteria)]